MTEPNSSLYIGFLFGVVATLFRPEVLVENLYVGFLVDLGIYTLFLTLAYIVAWWWLNEQA